MLITQLDGVDGPKRDDALNIVATIEITREPIPAHGDRPHPYPHAPDQHHGDLTEGAVAGSTERHNALTKTQPAEPKTLLLALQVGLLGRQFVLELTGEVIEEVVPAHAGTVVTGTDTGDTVFHRATPR